MVYSPFYIESFKTGLEKDKSDFQLLPDAFSVLQDAYVWRDRVSRKKGYQKMGRLLRTYADYNLGFIIGIPQSYNLKTLLGLETYSEIAPNSVTVTVDAGNPNQEIFTEPATPNGTLVGDGGGSGVLYYNSGIFNVSPGTGWGPGASIKITFSYFPDLPVMGLAIRELSTINIEETIAFDTKYAYVWSSTNSRFEELATGTTWNGENNDFFSVCNYYSATAGGNIMFATNFNTGVVPDPIRYYNGTWNNFLPAVDGVGNSLQQARFIVPFKGRLVALNTWTGATLAGANHNPSGIIYSQNGDAFVANAWRYDIAGKGGFLNASIPEVIVSHSFVRDTLVIGFEKSIWRLRYTGNEILPFVFEQIDNEYGVESSFSTVRVDNTQLSIGQKGIITCDGVSTKRIDEKIPNAVFKIHNDEEGNKRVHGIRDYDKELIYWCFPDSTSNTIFPNMVFVFNYENLSWAYFKDSFTCFGVLQEFDDAAWQDYPGTSWSKANFPWVNQSLQSLYPSVIAGNQQGYVLKLQQYTRNDPSLAITDIIPGTPVTLTIPNHNLVTGDYIRVTGILGSADVLNDTSYRVHYITGGQINLTNENGVPVTLAAGSTYIGLGEVIKLHDYRVRTKKFNFLQAGVASELGYIDFLVKHTDDGLFNVDLFADNNNVMSVNRDDSFFNTTVSTQESDSDMAGQDKLIHRLYSRVNAQFIQFELNLTGAQKVDPLIHDSDIEIYSMTLWASGSGRLV